MASPAKVSRELTLTAQHGSQGHVALTVLAVTRENRCL